MSKFKGFVLKGNNGFYYKGEDSVSGESRSAVTKDKEWAFHFDGVTYAHIWAAWLADKRGERYSIEEDK